MDTILRIEQKQSFNGLRSSLKDDLMLGKKLSKKAGLIRKFIEEKIK